MELPYLIPVLACAAAYLACTEWLNIVRRRWANELDLIKRRLRIYAELKSAVAPLREDGTVSRRDADRFARALAEMRSLFDSELELFVGGLYGRLLKKRALDALLAKAATYANSPEDRALAERGRRRSLELSSQITDGIDRDMPRRMAKFMRRRPAA